MFLHATATSQSEHDCAICWGRREPSAEWDLRVEPTAMELISPDSTREEITELYQDTYQLQSLPRRRCHEEGMEEHIYQEFLDSNKEHLWYKWPSTLLEAEQKQRPVDACRPNPQAEFAAVQHATYEWFATTQQYSCEEALALARYAHQCTLVAVAILEEKMKWMSHSLSCQHFGSCCHSGSHQCQRSQPFGWQREDPQVVSCHRDADSPAIKIGM